MAGLASVKSGQAAVQYAVPLPRRGGAAGRVCGWALSRYRAAPESRSEFTKFMRHYDIMLSTKPSPFQAHSSKPKTFLMRQPVHHLTLFTTKVIIIKNVSWCSWVSLICRAGLKGDATSVNCE